MSVDSRNPPKNQASRAISIALTDKAFTAVEREAKARGVSPEKLALAALADFLGRNAKTGAARNQPFILHLPGGLRTKIVKAAQTADISVNRFVVGALAEQLGLTLQGRYAPPCLATPHGAPLVGATDLRPLSPAYEPQDQSPGTGSAP